MESTSVSVARYLKQKLEEQQQINRSYSLRAFALRMGISAGGLVQIMSGKKKLSVERAHTIAAALKLKGKEKKLFLLSVEFEQSKGHERKAEIFEALRSLDTQKTSVFFDLSVEQFRLISNWYGLAILDCVSDYGRGFSDRDLARHFAISVNDAGLTLERLVRLELIEKDNVGNWVRTKGRLIVSSHVPNEAIRNYYKDVSRKSAESYDLQTPKEKVSAAETFSFDVSQIEEVRKLTDDYLVKLQALSQTGTNKTAMYQALVNIFRLSKQENI